MLYLSYIILIAAGLGLTAAAPRKHGHRSQEAVCIQKTTQVCNEVQEEKCTTVRKDVCEEQNVTEYETYTVTECSSFYLFMDEEECAYHREGEGENKECAYHWEGEGE